MVALTGDMDLISAPRLKFALVELYEAGQRRFVIDTSGTSFMDSTALGVLIGFRRMLGTEGAVAIAAAGPSILKVLEVTGLDRTFEMFAAVDQAVEFVEEVTTEADAGSDATRDTRSLEHGLDMEWTSDSDRAAGQDTVPGATLTRDAAVVAGIVATAVPFARTAEDQAEGWLQALRRSGDAAIVLSALGVSDEQADLGDGAAPRASASPPGRDVITTITTRAGRAAADRGDSAIRTTDLLLAVLDVYGKDFERTLERHGVNAGELVEQLKLTAA